MSPSLAQIGDRAADVLDDRGLDALRRLVEEEEAGPRHEGAADRELLLLPAGEVAAAAVQHALEDGEQLEHLVGDATRSPRQAGEARLEVLLAR